MLPEVKELTISANMLTRVDLAPGQYQLRLVAHNVNRGQTGSVHVDVDVPDFAKAPLSMSGLMLSVDPGRASAPRNALAGLVPLTPTAVRQFASVDRVTVLGRLYQGRSAKAALPGSACRREMF